MTTVNNYELERKGKDYHFNVEFSGEIEASSFYHLAREMRGLLGVELYQNYDKTKIFVKFIALGKERKEVMKGFLKMCMENPFKIG